MNNQLILTRILLENANRTYTALIEHTITLIERTITLIEHTTLIEQTWHTVGTNRTGNTLYKHRTLSCVATQCSILLMVRNKGS